MKRILLSFLVLSFITITPVLSFAQQAQTPGSFNSQTQNPGNFTQQAATSPTNPNLACSASIKVTDAQSLIRWAICAISTLIIPLLFLVAFAFFLWGVVKFIRDGDNEKSRTEGRKFMIYAVISLAVMVSIWGIIKIAQEVFGINYNIVQVQDTKFK